MDSSSCIVVGAGISGLLAARKLAAGGLRVAVLEEERGVGGRMATRRFGGGTFDTGAQFFTSRSETFEALVSEWLRSGAAVEWSRGFADANGERPPDGYPRYRGAEGMTSVPELLAGGLDVRTGERVVSVRRAGEGWEVEAESGLTESAGSLLLTPPAPRSLALAGEELPEKKRSELEAVSYAPCFAVTALVERPVELPEPGGIQVHEEPLDWISDNQRKGISKKPALTIHAGPRWSREHFDDPPEEVSRALLGFAGKHLGVDLAARTVEISAVRWRYSWVTKSHPERFLVGAEDPPLLFCGDGFGEAKVEGAALSGLAAAGWLLKSGG